MSRLTPVLVLFAALLAGCSDFPKLDDAISPAARKADYPALLPIDEVIAGADDVQITDASVATLKGHIARLRGRSARLQRPVIDAQTRNRMQDAINRHR